KRGRVSRRPQANVPSASGSGGIRAPNGWPANSPRRVTGNARPNTWFGIATGSMARLSPGGGVPRAFVIGRLRHACYGRMARSSGNALTNVVVFGGRHLRQLLFLYMDYYNKARGRTYP